MLAPNPYSGAESGASIDLWDIMQEFNVAGWMTIIEWLMDRSAQRESWQHRGDQAIAEQRLANIKANFDQAFHLCQEAGLLTAAELAREVSQNASETGYTDKNITKT